MRSVISPLPTPHSPLPTPHSPLPISPRDMLEFLMYKLETLLPEDQFNDIIAEFSIGKAQLWLDRVKEMIGLPCYDNIKEAFVAEEAKKREKLCEMNCLPTPKTVCRRKTIFQIGVGAEKHVNVSGAAVDNLFTGFFVGV